MGWVLSDDEFLCVCDSVSVDSKTKCNVLESTIVPSFINL